MGQPQGITILRPLFYAIVVLIFIYLPHGECQNTPATATPTGALDAYVGANQVLRVWQVIAIAIGGVLLLVIIISCFVKCRIPESQEKQNQRRSRRQDRVDIPLGRPVAQHPPQHQPRPDSRHQQYHDPHQVNIQLRGYPPQYDNRRQRESGYYQPHSPRHSAQPDRSDYRQSRQQVRSPPNAGRGGQF